MTLKYLVPALLVLTGAAVGLQAADGDVHTTDLRLEGVLMPEDYDYDATADTTLGSASMSGEDEFDDAFRVGIAMVGHSRGVDNGPIGMVGGGAIHYTRLGVDDEDTSDRFEALSAQLRLGLGIYIGDIFHIEATPFAGIGAARGKIDDAESDTGLYWEYGVSAGAFVNIVSLQLGVIGGWIHGEYDLDFDDNDNFTGPVDNVNVEIEHEGFFAGISIGARL